MEVKLPPQSLVAIDLDDTLYPEMDFVRSGFRAVAALIAPEDSESQYERLLALYLSNPNTNVFAKILQGTPNERLRVDDLVQSYRTHLPQLTLPDASKRLLEVLRRQDVPLALITDGRSLTQRNKISALDIEHYFSDVIISEETGHDKHSAHNFLLLQEKYPDFTFFYVADNPAKDFAHPNALGWHTICLLDSSENVHKQEFTSCPSPPRQTVKSLSDLSFRRHP